VTNNRSEQIQAIDFPIAWLDCSILSESPSRPNL